MYAAPLILSCLLSCNTTSSISGACDISEYWEVSEQNLEAVKGDKYLRTPSNEENKSAID